MFKVFFSIVFILFAQNGLARISPFPNGFMPLVLVCTDLATEEIVTEIYEKDDASKAWAGFISDEGESGLISVVRTEDGFNTKNGELNNFQLLLKEDSVYQVSLQNAVNGSIVIESKDVICSPPEQ